MTPDSVPSVPRLRLGPSTSRATLLDGGWWPRSTDPVTELPGLILAIDARGGAVSHVMLGSAGWESRPRRMGVADRVVRLGWFTSQPVGLLTATFRNGSRIDLLVVPPDTAQASAEAAMTLAADPGNRLHTPEILAATTADRPIDDDISPVTVWESEGGARAAAWQGAG
ncbi:MAG TPA: DUF5994 family protein [Mycobacteriales bacterium]